MHLSLSRPRSSSKGSQKGTPRLLDEFLPVPGIKASRGATRSGTDKLDKRLGAQVVREDRGTKSRRLARRIEDGLDSSRSNFLSEDLRRGRHVEDGWKLAPVWLHE